MSPTLSQLITYLKYWVVWFILYCSTSRVCCAPSSPLFFAPGDQETNTQAIAVLGGELALGPVLGEIELTIYWSKHFYFSALKHYQAVCEHI